MLIQYEYTCQILTIEVYNCSVGDYCSVGHNDTVSFKFQVELLLCIVEYVGSNKRLNVITYHFGSWVSSVNSLWCIIKIT